MMATYSPFLISISMPATAWIVWSPMTLPSRASMLLLPSTIGPPA